METRFIYRLFDSERPTITRYVGCTQDPKHRLYQHANTIHTSSLVRAWTRWLGGMKMVPQMEILHTRYYETEIVAKVEAAALEQQEIENHAINNQWLLNAKQWKRDKVKSGISQYVVSAYVDAVHAACGRENTGCYSHPFDTIAGKLEKAFPRLMIFHHRYLLATFSETT